MRYDIDIPKKEINVGDLVDYGGEICFVAYKENFFAADTGTYHPTGYPYILINLSSGQIVNDMGSIEKVNEYCNLILRNCEMIMGRKK